MRDQDKGQRLGSVWDQLDPIKVEGKNEDKGRIKVDGKSEDKGGIGVEGKTRIRAGSR